MSASPSFTLVVAADDHGGIGLRGALPWRLPGDLRRFKRLTAGAGRNAVLMGRATWLSLPPSARPLPLRRNIVLTRDPHFRVSDPSCTAHSLDDALAQAADCDAIFVIGGGQLYAAALSDPRCAAVELTRVAGDFHCDTFIAFPRPDFRRVDASLPHTDGALRYTFERWERP